MYSLIKNYCIDGSGLMVTNPANGAVIATITDYDRSAVTQMIEAADQARPAWASMTAKARAKTLRKWFDLIMAHQDELAMICTVECGKPLSESAGEVAYGAAFIEWFAEEGKRAYGETIPTFADSKRVLTIKQPVGLCAAITPWNFPIAMITRKAGPALASGCPIIVKPAESTPLSALALESLAHQAGIPRDIFRICPSSDSADIGDLFCSNGVIRKLSFTGSTRVGKILMAKSASTVKKVSMELGGNAPFIVFDDADLDAAVEGAMVSKFRNAGQTCVCANRILVQDGIHDAFIAKFSERVAALKIGDGKQPDTQIGPLIDGRALDGVAALVDNAIAAGAKVEIGGGPTDHGDNFYAPTILSNVTQDMEISQSEIFGPVAPVIRFTDEADAIKIANDTPYGLAAYFYSRDIGRVWRVMEALEYGMVGVNDGLISTEVAPFGGIKESGVGREGSRHGLDEYLELKYCLMGGLNT